ncbi:hypothetical protein [Congregibacter sp.]|uniref:hypothetical protein n=1 Tax=Congregibacter sp. TaxID=2744308 RepID=UPI003F6B643C
MFRLTIYRAWRLFVLHSLLLIVACASEPVQQEVASDPVDMSGNWELDYARSDNIQAQFNSMMRGLRAQAARNSNERSRNTVGTPPTSSQERLLAMAQMAEMITESQLLEIEQSRIAIRVEREGNFSLSCDYGPDAPVQVDYGLGSERCFWDGQQLVFQIRLPDGLDIVHRLSVAGSGDSLGIVTSLYNRGVSEPFSLRRVYRRYTPGSSGYRCTETLTRGRVCTTEAK